MTPDRRLRLAILLSLAAHAVVGTAWLIDLRWRAPPAKPLAGSPALGPSSETFAVTRLAPPDTRAPKARGAPVETARPANRGAGASSAPDAGSARAAASAEFVAELRARIEARKSYPRAARLRHQSGRVEVAFVVAKQDGEIRDVRLAAPSPYPALNEAALAAVREVSRYRPVPDTVATEDWPVVIAIDFVLGEENRGPEDEP